MAKKVTQLLAYFVPSHYDLRLDLNKASMQFSGEVTIHGKKVGRPTKRLTFHQKGLHIEAAHITKHDKSGQIEITPTRIVTHKQYDEVRLHSDKNLYPGTYTVWLRFSGSITTQMNGIYPSKFTHENKPKQLLATQFESHHAREAFPCIDEPAAKATFSLTTTSEPEETIISNTPVVSQELEGSRLITTFETTPRMSTYLLAFVAGELTYKEIRTKTNVTVRTYATPDNVAYTEFALEAAKRCLEFYDEYFGISYPLEKCDLIALPDFASGAMENWGCITFREQTLLVDPAHTTLSTKQYVAMVVAHELAHQWFGNLVTMRWWTDLWLNEGFASWIEYLAVEHMFPDWDMWTQFIASEQQQAMKLDTLQNTHPVEVPVKHPDEIRTIFDAISYSKGASVIHMLHEYLGKDTFRTGLQYYLEKHKYGSTDTIDLWQALEDSSDKPVRSFMQNWTSHSGFPVVHATVEDKTAQLEQSRFSTSQTFAASIKTTWPIPLLIQELDEPQLFDKKSLRITYSSDRPFKLNQSQSGFYRTLYNSSHTTLLGRQIQRGRLKPLDRIGILSDVLESAKYGYADTVEAISFLDYFAKEDNYAVWEIISGWLGSLKLIMNDEPLREAMKPFIRELVKNQLDKLGWEPRDSDSHFDKLLRPTIISMAAGADEQWVVDTCLELFEAIPQPEKNRSTAHEEANPEPVQQDAIHPDLRGVVFGTAARLGDETTFQKLVALHNATHLSEEKMTLAAAITGFKQPELIDRSLAMITSSEIRLQDVPHWVVYSFMNRHAKDKTWGWLKSHWAWLEENLGSDLSFYRMPLYAARAFSDERFIDEFRAFFEPKLQPALERPYKQAIEMLTWQSTWRAQSLQPVKQYFTAKYHQSD